MSPQLGCYDAFQAGDYVGGSIQLVCAGVSAFRLLGSLSSVGTAGRAGGTITGLGSSGGSAFGGVGNGTQNLFALGRLGNAFGNGARTTASWLASGTPLANALIGAGVGAGLGAAGYLGSTLGTSAATGQNQFTWGGFWGAVTGGAVAGAVYGGFSRYGNTRIGMMGISTLAGWAGGGVSGGIAGWIDHGFNSDQMWHGIAYGSLGGATAGLFMGAALGPSANVSGARLFGIGLAGSMIGGGAAGFFQGGLRTGTWNWGDASNGGALGLVGGGFGAIAGGGAFWGGRLAVNRIGNNARIRVFLRAIEDYWDVGGGISQDEARAIVQAEGFEFEIGRQSRFENARNSVVIGRRNLRDGQVNRIELGEEIQHGIDRATHEAARAAKRGLSNEEFHAEVFQRVLDRHANGELQFLTPEDIQAIHAIIQQLRP